VSRYFLPAVPALANASLDVVDREVVTIVGRPAMDLHKETLLRSALFLLKCVQRIKEIAL
jgi:hypothetical protein